MAKTIIRNEFDEAKWGELDPLEVAKQKTFTEMLFELLSERESNPDELKLFDLILNLSIDHGPDTPSAVKVVEAAKSGKSMSEALALGILQIGDKHGGAAEPLMKWLYKIKDYKDIKIGAADMVNDFTKDGGRVPGFGHRIYKDGDPRAQLILTTAEKPSGENQFVEILQLTKAYILKEKGKDLPINIDGAIAAALCSMNFKPEAGKGIFIIARTPGLIGQYLNNCG